MPLFIFYVSLFILFYVYLGYPMMAFLVSRVRPVKINKAEVEPLVSIVIAAYNEEFHIAETIRNKLELDYPSEKFEVVVISDGSTDQTDDIVRGFSESNVHLLRQEPRAGKTSALNMAIPVLKGEIIVFSDANSIYEHGAVRALVANFADPNIGYVTGKMVYVDPDGSMIGDGCSAYMKYENFIRTVETRLGSVVGVDGGIDAMRLELYSPLNADQLPDFVQPLKVFERGYRVIYESGAILKEASLTNSIDEYKMRVRVSLRALWAIYDMRNLLFFKDNLLFSWQLWSHKLLRYHCFIFLIGLFLSNLLLIGFGSFFVMFFIVQCIVYATAILEPSFSKRWYGGRFIVFARYFVLLNIASAHAWIKFIFRRKQAFWTPRKG